MYHNLRRIHRRKPNKLRCSSGDSIYHERTVLNNTNISIADENLLEAVVAAAVVVIAAVIAVVVIAAVVAAAVVITVVVVATATAA